ncbi:MAG: ABC transporter permease [Oscillospiraceae bacterium]
MSLISIFIGAIDINFKDILTNDFEQIEILIISRLPRLLAVILTGMGMSCSGLIMQNVCMNKFVSPSTGATIASAQLGILITMIFIVNSTLYDKMIFAFIFSIIGSYIFVLFIQKIRFKDIIMVPLIGIMFGNIISGVTEYLSYKHGLVQALSSWLVGDFSLIMRGRYEIVYITLPLILIAFLYANHFNIIGMGESFSKNLGVNYNVILFLGLSISSLITASIVVTVGSIPYIGLIVPNLVTMFKGDKIKNNLIDTCVFGAIFVLFCDIASRVVNFPYEIPVNLTVGIFGSLLFIAIVFTRFSKKEVSTK